MRRPNLICSTVEHIGVANDRPKENAKELDALVKVLSNTLRQTDVPNIQVDCASLWINKKIHLLTLFSGRHIQLDVSML